MSSGSRPEDAVIDYSTWLPEDQDAEGGLEAPGELGGAFAYDGRGFTAPEFSAFVADYNFGTIPPDFIVLHHTAKPTLADWTDAEAGLNESQIRAKRKDLLDGLMRYYHENNGWRAGPHLFIDDRYIWVFTPMREFGIHAMWGNSHNNGGTTHYSIGIEVIGNYSQQQWPAPVARLVGHAVAVLKQRLGTFELRYMYPDGSPGRKQTGTDQRGNPLWACLHPQKLAWGGISSHRDYNKPECPGHAITESYYMGVLQAGWTALTAAPVTLTLDSPLLGAPSGSVEQAIAFVEARLPADSEYKNDVRIILEHYWRYAPEVGVDPFLAAAQCIFETDSLRSQWAARPRRNPAGLGVRQEGGLSFNSWEESVQAHIGQILAFALRDDEANEAQRQMMRRNPRFDKIAPDSRGTIRTIGALSGRWNNDPQYGPGLLGRAQAILQG